MVCLFDLVCLRYENIYIFRFVMKKVCHLISGALFKGQPSFKAFIQK